MSKVIFNKQLQDCYLAIAIFTCCICIAIASGTPVIAKSTDWIVRSNEFADLLSTAIAAEDCQKDLVLSESLQEINPAFRKCRQKSIHKAVQILEQKLSQVKNPELHLDLEILLKFGRQRLQLYKLNDKYQVPYADLSKVILDNLKATLDETKSPSQQQKIILAKLKQYAGLEPGKISLTSSLKQTIDAQLQKSEVALPRKDQLEKDLKNNASQVTEIEAFLRQQEVPDYQEAYTELKTQLYDYETYIRREVLTKTKKYRLPAELYAFKLEQHGIEIPVEELIQQAHTVFTQIQQQMEEIAPQIAKKRGLKTLHYQDVIQVLRQEQLSAKDTLDQYQKRNQDLETIIQRENLLTLPKNKFNIRLATVQEKKDQIFPFYNFISNTVIIPVFQNPKKTSIYNDFTNHAASWTAVAHEGRPGHDLQFATVKNQDLSEARSYFAYNTTSVEGWATYAEIMMQPYMPLEGKFMSLRFQLLRAARAFLEPELQSGKITIADAMKVWTEDLGFSQLFVEEEIERQYYPKSPGRAPAYFYGSQELLQLRSQAEKKLGKRFNVKKFHDFVLRQGYLTPKLLEQLLQSNM
jgi:uncharacterized protein (DUF885 family)